MTLVRAFPSFKFAAFVCLFGFVSITATSRAQAQQGRRGGPPASGGASGAQPAASDAKPAAADTKPGATPGMSVTDRPLPPAAHVRQAVQMQGKKLHATVTV